MLLYSSVVETFHKTWKPIIHVKSRTSRMLEAWWQIANWFSRKYSLFTVAFTSNLIKRWHFSFSWSAESFTLQTHDLQNILESLYSMFPYCSQFSAALVLIADYLYGLRLCRSILCSKNGPRQMLVPCKEQTLGAASKSISWNHGLHLDQGSSFYGAKDLRSRWVGGNGLVLWHLELEELASRGPKATRSSDAWEAVEEARCFSGEGGPFALSIAPSGEAEKVQAWSRSKPKGWQRGLGSEDDPPLMLHLWGVSSLCMF